MHVQHGTSLFASVIAENHAAQWSRFVSQPVVMDRTAPVVTDVKVAVRYEGEGQVNVTSGVWVETEWSVTDEESHVMSCTCRFGKHFADRQQTACPVFAFLLSNTFFYLTVTKQNLCVCVCVCVCV